MKRMIVVGLALALGAAWIGTAAAAEQSVVFVNLDRVFNDFYKTKLADTQLKEQADSFNVERKKLIDDFNKLQDEFGALRDAAQNTALSEDARDQKRGEAEEKLVEVREAEGKIRRYDEGHRKQLDDQSRRMRKRIVDEIRLAINNYAREQGFEAVVDSSGQSLNGLELILYSDAKIDITDSVLEILNKGKVEEEAAPAAAAPAKKTEAEAPAGDQESGQKE